ncbi:hypothetical protein pdam_00000717 [Pocillopora damicornis]|uniref:Uncharacterized protein n=1 Tax=Pocillopora damicornis TaxID=46731 RepID=A0A3M6TVC7_POCDA|nr:hypothetical protein pdam_00000717 [Pocillopora damicornis]
MDTLYQLQFVTSPNEGFYEASVRMKKGVPSLVGDISRVDAYKDQPYCIASTYPRLSKYCYCSPKEREAIENAGFRSSFVTQLINVQ